MNDHRVRGGDQIQLVTTSSNATIVFARAILTYDDGEDSSFETLQTPNSDRTVATTILGRIDRPGFVTRCIVGVVGADVKRGEIFAELAVLDSGSRNADMLAAGYVGNNKNLPLGKVEQSTEGKGFMRTISLGDPAANADYVAEPVPANARWKVQGFTGTFVAAAGGSDRDAVVKYSDGTNIYSGAVMIRDTAGVAASQTVTFHGGIGTTMILDPTRAVTHFGLPDLDMQEAHEWSIETINLAASDNWGEGFIYVEEHIEI